MGTYFMKDILLEVIFMDDLLKKAKNNDNFAKEEIIKMYYPLIIKESKRVFLKNRSCIRCKQNHYDFSTTNTQKSHHKM